MTGPSAGAMRASTHLAWVLSCVLSCVLSWPLSWLLSWLLSWAVAVMATPNPARAQDLADKPIRMLVGIAAGGATDLTARFIAQKLGDSLRVQVYVENKQGGAYIPALKELTSGAPDGHTLLMISTANLVAQPMHHDYPFDLTKLTAITEVSRGPFILVARPGLGFKTVADLVAFAKANPDQLTFGSGGGTVSSLYLAAELLRLKTGIRFKHVTYRGAGPALADLLGGHIDAMFDAMPVMVEQTKAGGVVPLMVSGAKRSPALPDVPMAAEAGVADFDVINYFGLLGPAGMPPALVKRLRDEVAKAVAAPEVAAQFDSQGMGAVASEPGQFADMLRTDLARWTKIVTDAGIRRE